MPGPRQGEGADDEGLRGLGAQTSDTVKQAADVLERELSAGLEEARTLQQKFVEGRSLADGDLDDVTARLRRNAHSVIDVVSDRVTEMGATDVQDLNARFTKDAHQVFDSFLDLLGASPGLLSDVVGRVQSMAGSRSGDATPPSPGEPVTEAGPAAQRETAPRQAAPRKAAASKTAPRKAAPRKAAASKTAPRKAAPRTRATPAD